jgi:putative transposase
VYALPVPKELLRHIHSQSEGGRVLGISEVTFYNWKSKRGGLDVTEAQRLWRIEDENRRLKQSVVDLSLDREALEAVIRKDGWSLPA